MLSSLEILILSAIQGISEFLPISSVAHLVLISKYYVFTNQNLLIDICLHLGSLLAIVFYFRSDLIHFIKNKNFLTKILIATIPVIILLVVFINNWYLKAYINVIHQMWRFSLFIQSKYYKLKLVTSIKLF